MALKNVIRRFYVITFRHAILAVQTYIYRKLYGMDIGDGVLMSLKVKLDKTNPKGVHIGDGTYMAFGATVLTHDMCRNISKDVHIGKNCFLGARCIIMPGVTLGDSVVVGAGAVVTRSFGGGVVIAGNPAVVVKEHIKTRRLGILVQ